jgi:two-component system, chemotaxis family, response regulator Rcp1
MDILLVEDNPSDARMLTELLEEKGNAATMHWVKDGYQALDFVTKDARRPDVILLDLGLPRISGYEVLKKLKDDGGLSDIPVVILTTSRDPLDSEQCLALGADTFISKPFNLKGFEELAGQLMNKIFPRFAKPSGAQKAG